jgi:hypothetical protein
VGDDLGGLDGLRRGEVAGGDEVVLDGEGGAVSRVGDGSGAAEMGRGETALAAQGDECDLRAERENEGRLLFLDQEHDYCCRRRRVRQWRSGRAVAYRVPLSCAVE